MKTVLLTFALTGITAALACATPAQSLNRRRAEKKRDAAKTAAEAPAQVAPPAAAAAPRTAGSSSPQTATAAPTHTARTTSATPSESAAPAAAPAPAPVATGPSQLTRENKPPSTRFFSRIRTDTSRNTTKAQQSAAPVTTKEDKNLIYRRTWGPRTHRRPR